MWSRRRAFRPGSELEAALRSRRREAPPELVDGIGRRLAASPARPGHAWSRLAFAAALSVFVRGSFASFGGLSYAASGATDTYKAVKHAIVTQKLKTSVHVSSASGQYHHQPPHTVVVPTHHNHHSTPHSGVAGVQTVQSGTLPFTGFSLGATLALSLALIAAGIFLRRRERKS